MPKNNRVYISGAITGTDDYQERFARAEEHLREKGYSVINPARVNAQLPADTTYEEYMEMSLKLMNMCGILYQLKGWSGSYGAQREYGYALAKGMEVKQEWSV